jgi:hypothetical protein
MLLLPGLAVAWVWTAAGQAPMAAPPKLLAIYALAFDNDPNGAMNLTPYYTPTLQGIISATVNMTDKTVLILVDRDGYNDSQLLIVQNGVAIPVQGLPVYDSAQQTVRLEPGLREVNMADGKVLGALIAYARQVAPAETTLFSFIGHGAPLAPEFEATDVEGPAHTPTPPVSPTPAPAIEPLPPRWAAHAGLTDFHAASLLSIYDLAEALRIGTQNGQNPLAVLDLLHCFSASIEELYEVHPYVTMIAAAPNYAYSQPDMLGKALTALQPAMSPNQLVQSLVQSYDNVLPVEGHPRLLVAVESQKLSAIKAAWDQAAYHLYQALVSDPPGVRAKIDQAYTASAKYDTTLCDEQDWQLQPPDALSDMADFADQLGAQFEAASPIRTWALSVTQQISAAIVLRTAHNGAPWFVQSSPPPTWTFAAPGIALFTDFSPVVKNSTPNFSWQARWYTDTATSGNPHPYAFVRGGPAGITWADVFRRYWAGKVLSTTNCLPSFLQGRGPGELAVRRLHVRPVGNPLRLRAGQPISFSAQIQTGPAATNPLVRFQVDQGETAVFADVVGAGYLAAQTQKTVHSQRLWRPTQSGLYTLTVALDIDDRFTEENELDNTQQITADVRLLRPVYLPLVFEQ